MQDIVKLRNVSLTYHTPEGETPAIQDITFNIRKGEFVSIVGPSGCGKSTVLSIVSGLIKPTKGCVVRMGETVQGTSDKVGYMLQRDHLFEWRTIWENVVLGLEVRKRKNSETLNRVEALLNDYGLLEFRNHYPRELSGGMRQKVALIRTLALEPELLLLDEPFSALDYQTRLAISDEIGTIIRASGNTAILVTHDISEAISMGDRVLVFSKRPAHCKYDFNIELKGAPIQRRNLPDFQKYFDRIWKEIEVQKPLTAISERYGDGGGNNDE